MQSIEISGLYDSRTLMSGLFRSNDCLVYWDRVKCIPCSCETGQAKLFAHTLAKL